MPGNMKTDESRFLSVAKMRDGVVFRYETFLQERVRDKRIQSGSARAYKVDVQQFTIWLKKHGMEPLHTTVAQLRTYVEELKVTRSPNTIRRKLASLRGFYRWMQAHGLIQQNPTADLRVPRRRRVRREPLSAETVKRLLAAPRLSPKGVRDRALLICIALYGLSVSDVYRLDLSNVDLQAGVLRVAGDNRRPSTMNLLPWTADALRRWLAMRALLQPDTEAVFISLHWTNSRGEPHRRLSRRGIRQIVDGYLMQIGAKQAGVSCRSLRQTYAALRLSAGTDWLAGPRSVRHANTVTTAASATEQASTEASVISHGSVGDRTRE